MKNIEGLFVFVKAHYKHDIYRPKEGEITSVGGLSKGTLRKEIQGWRKVQETPNY